jgi:hypothetical protein
VGFEPVPRPYRYFEVIGSDTGKGYRIRHARMMNVDELDSVGRVVADHENRCEGFSTS